MKFKKYLQTGRFFIQLAAMALTLFGYMYLVRHLGLPQPVFLVLVLAAGMFFCGWCCPFGTAQEWIRAIGKKVGLNLVVPPSVDKYLRWGRYLIPLATGWLAWEFVNSRHAFVALVTGREATLAAYGVLAVILLASLAVDRPFCRYLCGFGAMYGLASLARVITVKRSAEHCVDCGRCDSACLMGIAVSNKEHVRDPRCINCFKCVSSCPRPGALKLGAALPKLRLKNTAIEVTSKNLDF